MRAQTVFPDPRGELPGPSDRVTSAATIPILLYHSIDDRASDGFAPWAMPQRRFAQHMAHLADHGHSTLTVRELVAWLSATSSCPLPDRAVVITFDDGFADFYRNALPLLTRHGLRATLYIATGHIGGASRWLRDVGEGDRPMLTWSQVREIDRSGIELGAHSVSHPQLDLLRPAVARAEIEGSRQALEDGIGRTVDTFAYPFGSYDRRVREMVVEAGFNAACAVKHAISHRGDDRFALARIIVRADDDVAKLARYLRGECVAPAKARERLRTRTWRHFRRALQVARRLREIGHEHNAAQ